MAKILTIYGIGSAHNYNEQYTTVVSLCNQTVADFKIILRQSEDQRIYKGPNSNELVPDKWADNISTACILVDGAPTSPVTAGDYIRRQFSLLKKLIDEFNPSVINAVGHSRGAIFCLYTINKLVKDDPDTKVLFNVFLIDPVDRTGLDPKKSLVINPLINGYRRIVMEDDSHNNVFPMPNIVQKNGAKIDELHNIRLPGTHGTATQLTPRLCAEAKKLPLEKGFTLDGKWPIAKTSFLIIAVELEGWGTKFKPFGGNTVLNLKEVTNAYGLINDLNLIKVKSGKCERLINDVDNSIEGAKPNKGAYIGFDTTGRNISDLEKLCPNPYRFSPLFINQQHVNLFKVNYANLFDAIPELYKSHKYWLSNLADIESASFDFQIELNDNAVKTEYDNLELECDCMYILMDKIIGS